MSFLDSAHLLCQHCDADKTEFTYTVTPEILQPAGYLHGGFSAAVAEHAASLAGATLAGPDASVLCISLEVHHLAPVTLGTRCICQAMPLSCGKNILRYDVKQYQEGSDAPFNCARVTLSCKYLSKER